MLTSRRSIYFVVAALLALLHGPGTHAAKGIYRGVATPAWAGGCEDIKALSHMSWYYGWALEPNIDLSQCDLGDRYIEFVPMIWGAGSVDGFVAKLPKNTKHLLGFNEPNIVGQAVMTPLEAATQWKKVIAQLKEADLLGKIRLGTPSASPGGSPLGPVDWFTQFFGNCTDCHFDFLCFHAYECNVGGLNYWVNQMETFGLPIWLTEFACPSNSGSVTIDDEVTYMQNALWSLDNNTNIERYSWFTARATNVGTLPSLLNAGAGSLTRVGTLYNSKGDALSADSTPSTASALAPGGSAAALVARLGSLLA